MSSYYIAKPGTQQPMGPYTVDQIRAGIQQGAITPDCVYCKEGMQQWLPVAHLPGLHPTPVPRRPVNATPHISVTPAASGSRPGNLMAWSVINLILAIPCCWIYGISLFLAIFALSNSKKVDKYANMHNLPASRTCARRALVFNIITSVILLPLYIGLLAIIADC